jgi:hypothetical protein
MWKKHKVIAKKKIVPLKNGWEKHIVAVNSKCYPTKSKVFLYRDGKEHRSFRRTFKSANFFKFCEKHKIIGKENRDLLQKLRYVSAIKTAARLCRFCPTLNTAEKQRKIVTNTKLVFNNVSIPVAKFIGKNPQLLKLYDYSNNYIGDSFDMAFQLCKYHGIDINTMPIDKNFHDWASKLLRELKHENKEIKYQEKTHQILLTIKQHIEKHHLSFVIPYETNDLINWSVINQHCLTSYCDKAITGKFSYPAVIDKYGKIWNLEIKNENFSILQFLGYKNAPAPQQLETLIKEVIQRSKNVESNQKNLQTV